MTNSWTDIKNTDLVVVMGGNAAEAHPCGFKWVTEAKATRGAKLIVVDPRYTRTASVSDYYAPIRQGTDIAFLNGVMKYCIDNDKVQWDYMKAFTNASYLVKDGFGYQNGLFTGYDAEKRDYDKSTWDYVLGDDGFVVTDPALQHPRCVWNLLKAHLAPYTPEMVERICGTPKDKFLKVAEMISECSSPTKTMTSMYALGWTQHSSGSQNIRAMAMLQLILGNIGVRGGGMNALRGHSNIQGLTDLGLMSHLLTGYLTMPTEKDVDFTTYMSTRQFKPLRPGQTSYWQNYRKFMVSFQKAMWGDAARIDNDWAFNYLSKLDVPAYDVLRVFELMYAGKVNGYICQGFNPLLAFPNRDKNTKALSNLKWLVTMDPLDTETARFWENHGDFNPVDTASIQTEVFQLPTTCFAEEEGSLTNSGRWLQWHWAGGTPPRRSKARHLHRRPDIPQDEGDVSQRGWRVPRSDPELVMGLCRSERTYAGGAGEGNQRSGTDGPHGSCQPDEGAGRGRQADPELLATQGRRFDHVRLLDLFRQLQRAGQQYGPPRQPRSGRHWRLSRLVIRLAA